MKTEAEIRDALACIDWMFDPNRPLHGDNGNAAAMGGILKWVLDDGNGAIDCVLARVKVAMQTGESP